MKVKPTKPWGKFTDPFDLVFLLNAYDLDVWAMYFCIFHVLKHDSESCGIYVVLMDESA